MRRIPSIAAVGAAVVVLSVGVAPFLASAADHLDAPNVGAIHVDGSDNLSVTKVNGPLDINDVYVFKGASAGHTVLAMTVNPAVNLGIGPSTFRAGGRYAFNVDTNGNSRADRTYEITFGSPNSAGAQSYRVVYSSGDARRTIATGMTGRSKWTNGVGSFAGVRSDPFFFDLLGFLGSVKGEGTRRLDDGKQSDFFVGLNTLAIVIEVPNSQIGGTGRNIGVWGTTRDHFGWLMQELTIDRFRALLPEAKELRIDRYPLPNLCAVNFVVHGLLGAGVSSSTRLDPQAKGIGEWLRARCVDLPTSFLTGAGP